MNHLEEGGLAGGIYDYAYDDDAILFVAVETHFRSNVLRLTTGVGISNG